VAHRRRNLSDDPDQEYFSDGITEDLTTDLSRSHDLFVISRSSSQTYKGRAVKVEDVARELGVRYVIEGSVRKAGERVRVSAQLIEASTGHHVWSERYDRELADIFALQSQIVDEIMTRLPVQIHSSALRRSSKGVRAQRTLRHGAGPSARSSWTRAMPRRWRCSERATCSSTCSSGAGTRRSSSGLARSPGAPSSSIR